MLDYLVGAPMMAFLFFDGIIISSLGIRKGDLSGGTTFKAANTAYGGDWDGMGGPGYSGLTKHSRTSVTGGEAFILVQACYGYSGNDFFTHK